MYHVSAQGVDERTIKIHYSYSYPSVNSVLLPQGTKETYTIHLFSKKKKIHTSFHHKQPERLVFSPRKNGKKRTSLEKGLKQE